MGNIDSILPKFFNVIDSLIDYQPHPAVFVVIFKLRATNARKIMDVFNEAPMLGRFFFSRHCGIGNFTFRNAS